MDQQNKKDGIVQQKDFKITGSEKASQLGPSSPYDRASGQPQADAAASSADNDMDKHTDTPANLQQDADEAQSDGELSFPKGK